MLILFILVFKSCSLRRWYQYLTTFLTASIKTFILNLAMSKLKFLKIIAFCINSIYIALFYY